MAVRTDLNGVRVRLPGNPPIYLIDEGVRRHIHNYQKYKDLFLDEADVVEDLNVNNIDLGSPLTADPGLYINASGTTLYFLDGDELREVRRNRVYGFDRSAATVIPDDLMTWITGDLPTVGNPML